MGNRCNKKKRIKGDKQLDNDNRQGRAKSIGVFDDGPREIKVVLVGDTAVGKSALIRNYL